MAENLLVTKADGSQEPFSVEKLRGSLERSGVPSPRIDAIVSELEPVFWSGIQTDEIYRRAFALLKRQERFAASRYSLRRHSLVLDPPDFHSRILSLKFLKRKDIARRLE